MIHLGPAGKPIGAPEGPLEKSFPYLKSLGLDAVEVQFVRGVYLDEKKAELLGTAAKEHGMHLSVHAPYYINLGSEDKETVRKSKERILESARIGAILGARAIAFHAGFYSAKDSAERIKAAIIEMADRIDGTYLCPETMGNFSKFGRLEELLEIAHHRNVRLTVDWCHLHALTNGGFRKEENFDDVLRKIEKSLGRKAVDCLHTHFSGVSYTEKGERSHLPLSSNEPDFLLLAKALAKWKPEDMTIICESPELEMDSVRMKTVLDRLVRT